MENSMVGEDKLANHSTEAGKDSTLEKPERVCYETKIIGGAVVRIPVRKVRTDGNIYLISNLRWLDSQEDLSLEIQT